MHAFLRVACLGLLLSSSAAWADIQFLDGNQPQIDDNVLFNGAGDIGGPANTVRGHLNGSPTTHVDFTSTTSLTTPSSGQALIEGALTTFTDLGILLTVPPGGTYTSLIFNINTGSDGDVTITATEGNGQVNSATSVGMAIDPLSNGQNFYTVVAINGQDIRHVTISSTVGIDDVRQVRIGGIQVAAVPEPSSVLLFGTMLAGTSYLLKRKHKSHFV